MTAIENYITEKKHSNPLGLLEDVRYKNTKDIVSVKDKAGIIEPTLIRSRYWNNLLLFSPVVILSGVVTYLKIPTHNWLGPLLITVIIAAILLIITIRSKQNPEITLTADKQKLVIKNSTYLWGDIINTYIMTEHTAKKTYKSLLLERPDGIINGVSIQYIGISDTKLAAIIEYYKNRNDTNTL